VAARSKTGVCGGSLASIVGSNPARARMSVVSVVCSERTLRRADHTFRRVLPIFFSLGAITL
jgi:hypothetical protein